MDIVTWDQARKQNLSRFFTGVLCVNGHLVERMTCNQRCVECRRAQDRRTNRTPEQIERDLTRGRARKRQDKVRCAERLRQWHKKNRVWWRVYRSRRKALKLNATPAWADPDAIRARYAEGARLTNETGIKHHVDHIVPLQSKLVCGLHCEANLQVLTETDNCSKNNRLWPDMP
jgi:hypothetical protein